LIAEGVVHEAQPGHYWLDLPAFNEQRRQRWVWSMQVMAVGVVVFVVVFLVRYFLKG
jgi:heme/copper-type cytochrome/quinol oxidase subunit 2